MVTTYKTITVTPESDLIEVLEAAANEPVVLEKDGMRFRLELADDTWTQDEAERTNAVLDATVGTWSDIDAESVIAELYEARERGSRPPERP